MQTQEQKEKLLLQNLDTWYKETRSVGSGSAGNVATLNKILTADEVIKSPGIPESVDVIQKLNKKKIPVISDIWIILLSGQTIYPTAMEGIGRNMSESETSRDTHKKTVHKERAVLLNPAFSPRTMPGANKL